MRFFDEAILKHVAWTVKFRSAIRRKEKAIVEAATIRQDNRCVLGKWLHGAGNARHGTKASFVNLVAKHADFHRDASAVADAINAEKYDAAESMLGSGSRYKNACWGVVSAISALENEIGHPFASGSPAPTSRRPVNGDTMCSPRLRQGEEDAERTSSLVEKMRFDQVRDLK